MSKPDAIVHVHLDGETHLVGSLWIVRDRRRTLSSTFQYAESWLEYGHSFAVDPPWTFRPGECSTKSGCSEPSPTLRLIDGAVP